MSFTSFTKQDLRETELRVDDVVRLFRQARKDLDAYVCAHPDSTVRMIPVSIWSKVRKALDLSDEVNAFIAQVRNA